MYLLADITRDIRIDKSQAMNHLEEHDGFENSKEEIDLKMKRNRQPSKVKNSTDTPYSEIDFTYEVNNVCKDESEFTREALTGANIEVEFLNFENLESRELGNYYYIALSRCFYPLHHNKTHWVHFIFCSVPLKKNLPTKIP